MAKVEKIDVALSALQALDEDSAPRNQGTSVRTLSAIVAATSTVTGTINAVKTGPAGKSVLTRIMELFEADPRRLWTVSEILDELERQGAPLQSARPPSAVRRPPSARRSRLRPTRARSSA